MIDFKYWYKTVQLSLWIPKNSRGPGNNVPFQLVCSCFFSLLFQDIRSTKNKERKVFEITWQHRSTSFGKYQNQFLRDKLTMIPYLVLLECVDCILEASQYSFSCNILYLICFRLRKVGRGSESESILKPDIWVCNTQNLRQKR